MLTSPWSAEVPTHGVHANLPLKVNDRSAAGPWFGQPADRSPSPRQFDMSPLGQSQGGKQSSWDLSILSSTDPCSSRRDFARPAFNVREKQSLADEAKTLTSRLFPKSPSSMSSSASSPQLSQAHRSAKAEPLFKHADTNSPLEKVHFELAKVQDYERQTPRTISPLQAWRQLRAQAQVPASRQVVTPRDDKSPLVSTAHGDEVSYLKEEVRVLTLENKQANMSEQHACASLQSRVKQLEADVVEIETDWQKRFVNAECMMEDELKSWGSLPVTFAELQDKMISQRAQDTQRVLMYEQELQQQRQVTLVHQQETAALRRKLQLSQEIMTAQEYNKGQEAMLPRMCSLRSEAEQANATIAELEKQLQNVDALNASKHNASLLQIAALEEQLDTYQAEARSLSSEKQRLGVLLEEQTGIAEGAQAAMHQALSMDCYAELSEKSRELVKTKQHFLDVMARAEAAEESRDEHLSMQLNLEQQMKEVMLDRDEAREEVIRRALASSCHSCTQFTAELQHEREEHRLELKLHHAEQTASKEQLQRVISEAEHSQMDNVELREKNARLKMDIGNVKDELRVFQQIATDANHELHQARLHAAKAGLEFDSPGRLEASEAAEGDE